MYLLLYVTCFVEEREKHDIHSLYTVLVLVHIGRPQSQIVAKKLKNKSGILIIILLQRVEIRDSTVKSTLSELASLNMRNDDSKEPYRGCSESRSRKPSS